MKLSKQDIANKCHKAWIEAENKRMQMTGVFSALRDYARPSVDHISSNEPNVGGSKDTQKHTKLFDSTLLNSVHQHGAGIKAWMSPANSFWFKLVPNDYYDGDEQVERWHHKASEILEKIIAQSNFHAEDFEAVLDGAALGTRGLMITEMPGQPVPFVCKHYDPATYAPVEDQHGFISEVYMTKNMSAKQAVKMFGEEAVPTHISDRFRTKPEDPMEDRYILCIYPREPDEYDSRIVTADNKPIASNWIHEASKTLVRQSGFDEKPGIFSRHLKWQGTPYGLAPAIRALADARQLNLLQCNLDLAVDVAVNPRLLIPVEMEGNINLMPGGATFYASEGRLPKTWANEGTLQEGDVRVRMRRQDIERALSLDVFRTFRNITKEITATEAIEIRQEAIDLFSPTFSLMSTEHYEPALQRIFNVCFRAGMFPEPPESMRVPISDEEDTILPPKVAFTSRMSLAITQRHKAAIDESLQRRASIAQFLGPAAFDDLKIPEALRMIDRGNGLPSELHRTDEELAQIMQQRAAEQAAAQQQQAIETAANAAGKLKGSKFEDQAAQAIA
jgi:hypothetical protein